MRDRFPRLPLWAVAAWVVLVVGVVGRVAFASASSGTVVPIYLKAGERWLLGGDVYAAAWPLDVYRNPPGVAAFFAPWSLLPPKTAGILWRLFGLAVYLTGLRAWLRQFPVEARSPGAVAFLAALLIVPSFNNGQVNVLLVGCLLHAAADLRRDRLRRAAAWVAFASFFKLYPLAVGLLFCVAVPRFAVRLTLAGIAFAVLPFACQRPDYVAGMHVAFVDFVELEGQYRELLNRPPWDWTMVPRAWLGVSLSKDAGQLVSAAAGLAFAAGVWFANRRRVELAFALGCVWMTVFGPATENATYTLLAPTAALLMVRPRPLGVAAVVLLSLPILRGLFPSSDVLPLRTAQPFGALLVLAMVVRDGVSRRCAERVRPEVVVARVSAASILEASGGRQPPVSQRAVSPTAASGP